MVTVILARLVHRVGASKTHHRVGRYVVQSQQFPRFRLVMDSEAVMPVVLGRRGEVVVGGAANWLLPALTVSCLVV